MDLLILGGSGRLGSRDFHPDDMIVLLMANAGVVSAAISVPAASQRHVEYMLQAFEAGNTAPLPAPPARGGLHRAMQRTQGITV
jgi:hypothetical protein